MPRKLKYLDNAEPRYTWNGKGGGPHLYGLPLALERLAADPMAVLYVVNGEPSVWHASFAGLAAISLATGEGGGRELAPVLADELATIGRHVVVHVVYDADAAGRTGGPKVAAALAAVGIDAAALDLATWKGWEASGPPHGADAEDLVKLAIMAGVSPAAVLAELGFMPPLAPVLAAPTSTVDATRETAHPRHAWGAAALQNMMVDVAAAPRGQRASIINATSYRLGRLLVSPWAGLSEAVALAAMMDASESCGYVAEHGQRATLAIVRSGIKSGKRAGPHPEPAHSPDWKSGPGVDELRHQAERVAVHAFEDAKAAGSDSKRAESIARISAALTRLCVARGRPSVSASCGVVALEAGVDKGTVSRAMDRMRRIGWQIQVGGIDDDGRLTATVWTMPESPSNGESGAMQRCVADYPEGLTEDVEGILKDARCIAPFSPAGLLTRGMQRRLEDVELPSIGASGRRLLLVLADHGESSILQAAALAGLSIDTTRRAFAHMEARGIVTSHAIPTKGRKSRAYMLTDATAAILQGNPPDAAGAAIASTLEAGGKVVERAQERIEADRARMDRAGKVAAVRGMSRRAALRLDRATPAPPPGARATWVPAEPARRRSDAAANLPPAYRRFTSESPCPAPASTAASVADTGAGLVAPPEASQRSAPARVLRWLDDAPPLAGMGEPMMRIGVGDPRPSWQRFMDECDIEAERRERGRAPLPLPVSEPRRESLAAD